MIDQDDLCFFSVKEEKGFFGIKKKESGAFFFKDEDDEEPVWIPYDEFRQIMAEQETSPVLITVCADEECSWWCYQDRFFTALPDDSPEDIQEFVATCEAPAPAAPTAVEFSCPNCQRVRSIFVSLEPEPTRCSSCNREFMLWIDPTDGQVVVARIKPSATSVNEATVEGQPPFDPLIILGLHANASPMEIKGRYRQLVMQYHPDRVAHLGEELRSLAERKMREINAAVDQLLGNPKHGD